MKTFIITALVALTGSSFVNAAAFTNCSGTIMSIVCSDSSVYQRKSTVTFKIEQHRIPLFIGQNQHPWHITDTDGNTIFTPASVQPNTQPDGSFVFTDSWDQKNDKGHYVKEGTYYIVFPNMPYNETPLAINIESKKDFKNGK
jgi:flagellar hook assembly protein FlgD